MAELERFQNLPMNSKLLHLPSEPTAPWDTPRLWKHPLKHHLFCCIILQYVEVLRPQHVFCCTLTLEAKGYVQQRRTKYQPEAMTDLSWSKSHSHSKLLRAKLLRAAPYMLYVFPEDWPLQIGQVWWNVEFRSTFAFCPCFSHQNRREHCLPVSQDGAIVSI